MATIKIRVGVGLEANPAAVFAPIPVAAHAAAAKVNAEWKASGKAQGAAFEQASAQGAKAAEKLAAAEAKTAKKRIDSERKALAEIHAMREKEARESERLEERVAASKIRSLEKTLRATEKGARAAGERAWKMVQSGGRFAATIARGAGIDLDVGSAVGRAVANQGRATDLSNASFNTGIAGSESRADPAMLLARARAVGMSNALDTGQVLGGLQAFVGKTGDLKTALALLDNMAKLSKATGANFDEMANMAGEIANGLGDVENKGDAVFAVMRGFAGQGKLGSVEVKELQSQAAKLVGAAQAFGGDRSENLLKMGALAQLSKARGGATSASEAATSVAGLANTLKITARRKAFEAAGITLEDKQGKLRDPFALLKESITKAKNTEQFKDMWKNVIGAKPAEALRGIYQDAGGGSKGLAAIDAELKRYMSAGLSQKELDESAKAKMSTTESSVARFNNAMEKSADVLAAKLGPAVEKLLPVIEKIGDVLAKVLEWVGENPKAAAALGAGGAALAAAGPALLANPYVLLGAGLAAAATLLYQAGTKLLDAAAAEVDKGDTKHMESNLRVDDAAAIIRGAQKTGQIGNTDLSTAKKDLDELQTRITSAKSVTAGDVAEQVVLSALGPFASMLGTNTGLSKYASAAIGEQSLASGTARQKDIDILPSLEIQNSILRAGFASLTNGTLSVKVTNLPASGFPAVDPSNRTGP